MICEGRDLIRVASTDPFAGEPMRLDIVRFVSVFAKRPRRLPTIPFSLPADGKWGLKSSQLKTVFSSGCIAAR
jgi:hypothetical protein